jgi:hypothetical protein
MSSQTYRGVSAKDYDWMISRVFMPSELNREERRLLGVRPDYAGDGNPFDAAENPQDHQASELGKRIRQLSWSQEDRGALDELLGMLGATPTPRRHMVGARGLFWATHPLRDLKLSPLRTLPRAAQKGGASGVPARADRPG